MICINCQCGTEYVFKFPYCFLKRLRICSYNIKAAFLEIQPQIKMITLNYFTVPRVKYKTFDAFAYGTLYLNFGPLCYSLYETILFGV